MGHLTSVMKCDTCQSHVPETRRTHSCTKCCLGPLSFHPSTKGLHIIMSKSHRMAERQVSFHNGIVLTNRAISVREQVQLQIERTENMWHGALRLGFTSFCPSHLSQCTLPPYACPDLDRQLGFWVAPLPEECARQGDMISFWVSRRGRIHYRVNDGRDYLLLEDVDVSKPLWGLIDVYGQTVAIKMLGSVKKGRFLTYKVSCPPEALPDMEPQKPIPDINPRPPDSTDQEDEDCLVCFSMAADTVLTCGHQCMCTSCALIIKERFGVCPLCRQVILTISQRCPSSSKSFVV
ncbi:E3 ubiquitin-protein ligase NEURL3 [Polypterus senegalus]|uniref:E3 ubiquitin-protein ligase NEURL3 n=1 Tax=Polypterus senegalus TaxID=55291 RepID=UPI0019639EF1|nr:E3 ubiquitin-protein ligase NEURL3 [Polypterus senegalus]